MSRRIILTAIVLLCVLFTGCLDADGDRITMQRWWKSRFHTNETRDSQTSHPPHSRTDQQVKSQSKNLEQHERPTESSKMGALEKKPTAAHRSATIQQSGRSISHRSKGNKAHRSPPAYAVRSDALVVNDEMITVNDILEPILPMIRKFAQTLSPETYYQRVAELVRQQIVDAVAQHLIYRRARLQITDQIEPQIQKAVDNMERDRINREFGGLETQYEKYLLKQKKSRKQVQDRLRRAVIVDSYLREKLVRRIPDPRKRELLNYYRDHLADYSESQRREMFLIDVMSAAYLQAADPWTIEARTRAEQKARHTIDAAAQALQQGQSFEEVAKHYSKGLHKKEGGSWGFISAPLKSRWTAPSKRLFQMQPGEISEVLQAEDSFFIVKLGRIEGGKVQSFQEAQPQIIRTLKNRSFQKLKAEFLQTELERSTIGSLDSFISQVLAEVPSPIEPTVP